MTPRTLHARPCARLTPFETAPKFPFDEVVNPVNGIVPFELRLTIDSSKR
jgi:hypothetical protein